MPLHVSSVTYGRAVLFVVLSNREETEFKEAFTTVFRWLRGENVDVSEAQKKLLDEVTIEAIRIDGNGIQKLGEISGLEGFVSQVKLLRNYTSKTFVAPLHYTLRTVWGNEILKPLLSTEYNVRHCTRSTIKYRIRFMKFDNIVFSEKQTGKEEYLMSADLYILCKTPLKKTFISVSLTPRVDVLTHIIYGTSHSIIEKIPVNPPENMWIIGGGWDRVFEYEAGLGSISLEIGYQLYRHRGGNLEDSKLPLSKVIIDLNDVLYGQELYFFQKRSPDGSAVLVYRVDRLPGIL